ncbi:MAG: hypothetical protein C0402_12950, partial [Thermodesulfovibrio sp.]|nr:hypothetical protein [Thermodesulfovibrio sp.]
LALYYNTGSSNTAIGDEALYYNTGSSNTAIGFAALYFNTRGTGNTAIGSGALPSNGTGDNNTAIGYHANVLDNLNNATAIGANAEATISGSVVFGDNQVSWIGGHSMWNNTSDIREKKDIQAITVGLDFIKALKPVEFRMKTGNNRINFGFIAQDIEELIGTEHNILGIGGDKERTLSLAYTGFIAPMVKAMQEKQQIIDNLNNVIDGLNDAMAKQDDDMSQMRKELDELKALVLSKVK